MTAPRRLRPGTTYLVTRRCLDRQFLLRPSKVVKQAFGFLLAIAARRFDIDLHACCVMSNQMGLSISRSAKQHPGRRLRSLPPGGREAERQQDDAGVPG